MALVCVAAGVVGTVWARGGDEGPNYPSAWDPKVRQFVKIVERERGLEFKHPVHVDFLSQKKFREKVTRDEQDVTKKDRAELKRTTSMFRALGLIEGKLDLFESINDLHGSGIVGLYSYDDERIRIRGKKLTPAVRSTLVHELTHALQDQYFDLGARMKSLEDDPTGRGALQAVAEGDASRIETKWRSRLGAKGKTALDNSSERQLKGVNRGLKGVPEVFKTLMAAPYVFGEALLNVAEEEGGDRAVDNLFQSPPRTDEQQFDPWTLIEDHQGYLNVEAPRLAEGEKAFDDGPFGSIAWLLMLSERIPPEQALTATDGWGGDAYVAFERQGVSCVRMRYAGDTPRDVLQMHGALSAWVKRLPGAPTSVRRDGRMLAFESCDPGSDAASVATGGSTQAVQLAVIRTYTSTSMMKQGVPKKAARCSADRIVHAFTMAELTDPTPDLGRIRSVIGPCLAR